MSLFVRDGLALRAVLLTMTLAGSARCWSSLSFPLSKSSALFRPCRWCAYHAHRDFGMGFGERRCSGMTLPVPLEDRP